MLSRPLARSQSGNTVQVVVAIIGVVGALGAAVIANWDKIFPKPPSIEPPAGVGAKPEVKTPIVPKTEACSIAGRVFDRDTHAPLAGVFIDFYTYRDASRIKESRLLQAAAAITGPDGTFKAVCRSIPESEFPLRVAVGRRGGSQQPITIYMPLKVELHDTRTDVNLPAYFVQ